VATKIKLMRLGKMRDPHYRIVVADARTKRDGRSIETIGEYHPKSDPSVIKVNADRAAYWLGVGAQPTEAVTAIFEVTGDWQKFKGQPAPEPMKLPAQKPDKQSLFNAALAEVSGEPSETKGGATTPRKRAAKKAAEPAADAAPAAEPTAEPSAEQTAEPATEATAEATAEPAAEADAAAEPAPEPAATDESGS
jgi:small subunit ribosomal protein S16